MQVFAGLCLLLFVATATGVGVRMLLLAWRTRRLPELLVGAGSVLVTSVGFLASVASGFGGATEGVNVPLWAASEAVTQLGIVLMYLFTQQVFRPGVGWAKTIVAAAALLLPAGLAGAVSELAAAAPGGDSVQVTGDWLLLCYVGYAGSFVWTAVEALRHHRMALRRLALGLADPVVTNRFLLWAVYGLSCTGVTLANALGVLLEVNLSTSLVVLLPSALLGVAASAAMYLAFLPPAWYLARIRVRASAG